MDNDALKLKNGVENGMVVELADSFVAETTNSFHDLRTIGEGGSGKVYKGLHPVISGSFAVKKLDVIGETTDEFTKEIEVLSQFRHPHIIRLYAFSRARSRNCLVFEIGTHGNVSSVLSDAATAIEFTWKLRVRYYMRAACGLAKALNYLHKHGAQPVFHRYFRVLYCCAILAVLACPHYTLNILTILTTLTPYTHYTQGARHSRHSPYTHDAPTMHSLYASSHSTVPGTSRVPTPCFATAV
jgi:hypothetical protein